MFEQEIKQYLKAHNEPFADRTESHSAIDFFLPQDNIYIDAKEKRQQFAMNNWREAVMPQEFLFILDDLAVRKLLFHAPNSFILICDTSSRHRQYFVYSIVDLLCIPKKRCRRPIRRSVPAYKGKWLIDLRDAASFDELQSAMDYLLSYKKKFKPIFETHIDCWGKYPTENIGRGGSTRTAKYWKKDSTSHN